MKDKDPKKEFKEKLKAEKEKKEREKDAELSQDDRISKFLKKNFIHYGRKKQTGFLPSGILPFDLELSTSLEIDTKINKRYAIPGTGIPSGLLVMIYGLFGSGKSTIAGNFMAKAQQLGGKAILIDHEVSSQRSLLHCIGVDIDKLEHIRPDNMEESLNCIRGLIKDYQTSKTPVCIVVDSVPAMNPDSVNDVDYKEHPPVAKQALLMTRFLNEIRVDLSFCNNLYLIFINQQKGAPIGQRTAPGVIPPDNYPCQNSLNYYSDIIIKMSKRQSDVIRNKKTDVVDHIMFTAEFKKNKMSSDLRQVKIPFFINPQSVSLGCDDYIACREYCIKNLIWKPEANSYIVRGEKMTPIAIRDKMIREPEFREYVNQLVINHYLLERGFDVEGERVEPECEE